MSKDWFKDMQDFERIVMLNPNVGTIPHVPDLKRKKLRRTLIREEVSECLKALKENNLEKLADGIADSIVVLLGTAVTYGIDIRSVWDEVHATNMAKATGEWREDGKRLKPADWKPPRVAELLKEQEDQKMAITCETCDNEGCANRLECPGYESKEHESV